MARRSVGVFAQAQEDAAAAERQLRRLQVRPHAAVLGRGGGARVCDGHQNEIAEKESDLAAAAAEVCTRGACRLRGWGWVRTPAPPQVSAVEQAKREAVSQQLDNVSGVACVCVWGGGGTRRGNDT